MQYNSLTGSVLNLVSMACVTGTGGGRGGARRRAGRQPNGRPLLRGAAARRSNAAFRRRLLRLQEAGIR
jgi:hypothetical protein